MSCRCDSNGIRARWARRHWADEVVHANLGRKWMPDLMGEEIGFVREIAQKELDHFSPNVIPLLSVFLIRFINLGTE
jgi:hypothetical protein